VAEPTSLYTGDNYEALADYLQKPYSQYPDPPGPRTDGREEPMQFVTLHDLNIPERTNDRIKIFSDIRLFEETMREKAHSNSPRLLLFMRGYPTPEWLNTIGWLCNVDPEFYLRHLNFKSEAKTNYFTSLMLPSSTSNIIRLRTTSIGYRQRFGRRSQQTVETLRKQAQLEMENYRSQLNKASTQVGHSIVRSFAVHDQEHYTLEQEISICTNEFGVDQGWVGRWLS
jgi:hypothetical protein